MDVPTIIFIACLALAGLFMLWFAWTMLFGKSSSPGDDSGLGDGIAGGVDSSSSGD